MTTINQALAEQLAKTYSRQELQRKYLAELEAAERQVRHNKRVGSTVLGLATLTAHRDEAAVLRAALAIKNQ